MQPKGCLLASYTLVAVCVVVAVVVVVGTSAEPFAMPTAKSPSSSFSWVEVGRRFCRRWDRRQRQRYSRYVFLVARAALSFSFRDDDDVCGRRSRLRLCAVFVEFFCCCSSRVQTSSSSFRSTRLVSLGPRRSPLPVLVVETSFASCPTLPSSSLSPPRQTFFFCTCSACNSPRVHLNVFAL